MKLRHAALIFVVGWMIMKPPGSMEHLPSDFKAKLEKYGKHFHEDLKAPLKDWERYDEYAFRFYRSKAECEATLSELRASDPVMTNARCVDTHDPRLERTIGRP